MRSPRGGSISETVGAGLIDDAAITWLAATAGPLTATAFMAFGIYSGYPVPAAFATTGAMVGVGLSLGGTPVFDTYRRIVTFWALVPPVSGTLAYLTATMLRRDDIPETVSIPVLAGLVGGIVANVQLSIIPAAGEATQNSIAGFAADVVAVPSIGGVDLAFWLLTLVSSVVVGFGVYRVFTIPLGV